MPERSVLLGFERHRSEEAHQMFLDVDRPLFDDRGRGLLRTLKDRGQSGAGIARRSFWLRNRSRNGGQRGCNRLGGRRRRRRRTLDGPLLLSSLESPEEGAHCPRSWRTDWTMLRVAAPDRKASAATTVTNVTAMVPRPHRKARHDQPPLTPLIRCWGLVPSSRYLIA